jgi:hypothetical protein
MNSSAILIFVLSSGLLAFLFRNKFKKSYPNDSSFGSVRLKYVYVCCLAGFLITGIVTALLNLDS